MESCDVTNPCVAKEIIMFDRTQCGCQSSCSETVYDATVSSSLWPSQRSWISVAKYYNLTFDGVPITNSSVHNRSHTGCNEQVWVHYETLQCEWIKWRNVQCPQEHLIRDKIRSRLARLNVYFHSTRRTIIMEEAVFNDLYSLFTELGGALSIWVGFSFIMFAEVIELVIDGMLVLIHFSFRRSD